MILTEDQYIPISTYLSSEVGTISGQSDQKKSNMMKAAGGGTTIVRGPTEPSACEGNCSGSCSGGCSGSCSGTCDGTCDGGCYGSCSSSCDGTCVGNCSGNCAGTCTDGCETYCAEDGQTFCDYEQTFSENDGDNPPTGAGTTFTWSTTVAADATIDIRASDWNTLASYVEAASVYCGENTITSLRRAAAYDPITASIFNNLNSGIASINSSHAVGSKTADVDLIRASEINALATSYNEAQINEGLPETDGTVSGLCCQLGEACMTKEEGRPSLQDCTNGQTCPQSPLH